ncbi:HEPN domain-containing protein [Proteiniphilum sp.]|uniref:ApeA N-terminal domain 1-containing protein n=1 Tax=Proteiniphilum sp. TaxID=1926877 RepID=UPI003320D663
MIERIEDKGYWYLPEKPDETIAGILTYTPNESISLELIGSFGNEKNSFEALFNNKKEKVIYGITADAKKITLINCHSSGSRNFSCPFSIIKYNCQYLIRGKHILSLKEPSFFKADVSFPLLTYWCYPEALRNVSYFNKEEKFSTITISFDAYDEAKNTINVIQIDNNTELYLTKGINYSGSDFFLTPKLEQYTSLEIHKQDDSSIEDYLSIIFPYEQFLSLATLEVAQCSKIRLYDRNQFQQLKNGEKIYHKIELIYVQHEPNSVPRKIKPHNFLFDYHTIEEQYPYIIRKWCTESEDIAPIRTHLIESIKNKTFFSSIDFLIVIQALEGFCTRFRKEDALSNMLNSVILEFSGIDKIKIDNICIQEVIDSRNYYSHFMERVKKKHILDGVELYVLTHKLRKLLICCLLQFIGFDNSQINVILNNSNSSLLASSKIFEESE